MTPLKYAITFKPMILNTFELLTNSIKWRYFKSSKDMP